MGDKRICFLVFIIICGEVLAQFRDVEVKKSNDKEILNGSNFHNFLAFTEEMMWVDQSCSNNGVPNLVQLIEYIINTHMKADTPVILFDEFYSQNANFHVSLKYLQMRTSSALRYGKVMTTLATPQINNQLFKPDSNEHLSFFIIIKNLDLASDIIELYVNSRTKVVIISQATKFHLKTFLSSPTSRLYPNLLVVEDPNMQLILFENLTRSGVSLFPNKFKNGLKGQHFVVSATEAPPFVLRKRGQNSGDGYMVTKWEGIEIRLIESLAVILGFTYEFIEPQDSS